MSCPWRRLPIFALAIGLAAAATGPARGQWILDLPQDYLRLKFNERRLDNRRAQLQADIDRGDAAAMAQDLQRVRKFERKVATDEWIIRGDINPLATFTTHVQAIPPVGPNPTLIPHPQYPGYGYFAADPTHLYRLPQAAAAPATVSIEIVNAGAPGRAIDYTIDGVAHKIEGGRRETLAVGPASVIAFDRGDGRGEQRYSLSPGAYEFRPDGEGRSLVRLAPTP